MYNAGAGAYFDALTVHPYASYWNNLPALYQIMVAHGDAKKKVWITEYGDPTFGAVGQSYVTEAQQAIDITTALQNVASMSFVGPFFVYNYRDGQALNDPSPDREGYFGLLRSDNGKKPAYFAVRDTIQQLYL
jgi:exo-beta-1,3-glucanase (GH17 family)